MRAKTGAFGPVTIGLDAGLGFGAFAMVGGEPEFVRVETTEDSVTPSRI